MKLVTKYARTLRPTAFDAILTNPPFGSDIPVDDPHILARFQLPATGIVGKNPRASMPPEQLFIERCLQLLRPGGRMAIVLPDSILSNPGLLFIRQWLLQRTRLIASIDLPGTAFQPHTGTQTSVLILQKKTDREMEIEANSGRPRNYEVFMATPEAVGKDRRGNTLHLRTPEGNLIEHEEEEIIRRQDIDGRWVVERRKHRKRMVHDELPLVVDYFEKWVNRSTIRAWLDG